MSGDMSAHKAARKGTEGAPVQSAPIASNPPTHTPRPWGCRWPECDCYAPGAPQECRATQPVPEPAATAPAPLDLEAIREREAVASDAMHKVRNADDAYAIEVALNDIPALLAELVRLHAGAQAAGNVIARYHERLTASERRIAELEAQAGATYCAYCGERFALDAPDATTLVGQHIATCPDHPMRAVEAERDRLQEKIEALSMELFDEAGRRETAAQGRMQAEAERDRLREALRDLRREAEWMARQIHRTGGKPAPVTGSVREAFDRADAFLASAPAPGPSSPIPLRSAAADRQKVLAHNDSVAGPAPADSPAFAAKPANPAPAGEVER